MSSIELLRIFESRRLPVILQTEAAECGLACLAMIAGYYGFEIDVGTLRRRFSVSIKGMTLKALLDVAQQLGLGARGIRLDVEELNDLRLPAILHWNLRHFVVLKRQIKNGWEIHDPKSGLRRISDAELSEAFSGIAVELAPSLSFTPASKTERLSLTQLWTEVHGLGKALVQAILLTVILQAWVIASPYYAQIAVDDVLPRNDMAFLNILLIGFGMFALINAFASATRQLLFLSLGNLVSFQMASNVAGQLLRLPISYFEKRHSGDIISRFGSVQPIQTALTTSILSALVDATMVAITAVLMCIYSLSLSLVALLAVVLLILSRGASFQTIKTRNYSSIVAQAKHDSFLLESVRGITTLRLFAAESSRHNLWQSRLADVANAKLGIGQIQAIFGTFTDGIISFEALVSVYLAIRISAHGGFTVGMIFAYLAYKSQFIGRANSLIDRWIEFRMLDLYTRRLGDIVLTPRDPTFSSQASIATGGELAGAVAVKGVGYRYGEGEPWVITDANLSIGAGEHVAIVGSSGCGKTTLMKIMLCLLRPECGTVFVDNMPIDQFGIAKFREQVAAVMQDDKLFAGTVADNIALFDPNPDMDWIIECSKAAAIHADIMATPMRYESLVGDMGSSFSGGQKQRLFLARALYRRPRILFIDEGTSHLDIATEGAVSEAIRKMGMTRIVIAHRSETVRHADRTLTLKNGRIIDSSSENRMAGLLRAQRSVGCAES